MMFSSSMWKLIICSSVYLMLICIRCLFFHYLMFFSCSYNVPLLICCSSLSADQPKTPDKQNSASVCHLLSFFSKLIWCSSFNMFPNVTFIIWCSVLVHMMLIGCSFLSADQQKNQIRRIQPQFVICLVFPSWSDVHLLICSYIMLICCQAQPKSQWSWAE